MTHTLTGPAVAPILLLYIKSAATDATVPNKTPIAELPNSGTLPLIGGGARGNRLQQDCSGSHSCHYSPFLMLQPKLNAQEVIRQDLTLLQLMALPTTSLILLTQTRNSSLTGQEFPPHFERKDSCGTESVFMRKSVGILL